MIAKQREILTLLKKELTAAQEHQTKAYNLRPEPGHVLGRYPAKFRCIQDGPGLCLLLAAIHIQYRGDQVQVCWPFCWRSRLPGLGEL